MSDTGREGSLPAVAAPAANPETHETDPHEQHQQSHQGDAGSSEPSPNNPPFEPLFTLVDNATTNTTIHPRIHYIFSDDDPSILSSAVTAAAAAETTDRTILVDLAPSPEAGGGWGVSWASSLTPDFAITDAQLQQQSPPQKQQQQQQQAEVMLRIEGVEREPVVEGRRGGGPDAAGSASRAEDVESLMDDFERRMAVLRKVVASNDKRAQAIGRQSTSHRLQQGGEGEPGEGVAPQEEQGGAAATEEGH